MRTCAHTVMEQYLFLPLTDTALQCSGNLCRVMHKETTENTVLVFGGVLS